MLALFLRSIVGEWRNIRRNIVMFTAMGSGK